MIPDYQTVMLPLLQLASDGKEYPTKEATARLADLFDLSVEDREALLPSGTQKTFTNRVGWALTYLKKAGLLQPTKFAHFKITTAGRALLAKKPSRITNALLSEYSSFNAFRNGEEDGEAQAKSPESQGTEDATPESRIDAALRELDSALADDLLDRIRTSSWQFFEKLVIDVLLAMGYGAGDESGHHLGKTGDEGVDGLINQDELGLEQIYLQAKRWTKNIGAPELHAFVGALSGKHAQKGVFLTTSSFTGDAEKFANSLGSHRVVLVDGRRLAQLMIKHGVGVQVVNRVEIKRVDSDFFPTEDIV